MAPDQADALYVGKQKRSDEGRLNKVEINGTELCAAGARQRPRATAGAAPSHDQVVRHIGDESAVRMVRNDTEVVG